MSKKNLAKRLIALVAIVAMFAAMTITASAANYSSTTMYVNEDTVKVTTYVTGLTAGDEVTYYAKNSESDVYVNQYTAEETTMKQSYVADAADITGLDIKMAKVTENFENPEPVDPKAVTETGFAFEVGDKIVKQYAVSDALPAVGDMVLLDIPAYKENKAISSFDVKIDGVSVSEAVPAYIVSADQVSFVNEFEILYTDVEFDEETATATAKVSFEGKECTAVELVPNYLGDVADVQIAEFRYERGMFDPEYTYNNETYTCIASLWTANLPESFSEVGVKILGINGGVESVDGLGVGETYQAYGVTSATNQFAVAFLTDATSDIESITFAPYYVLDGETVVDPESHTVDNIKNN